MNSKFFHRNGRLLLFKGLEGFFGFGLMDLNGFGLLVIQPAQT